jgi:hypothetical protein
MQTVFKVCAFADEEVGYVAIAAAAPGLSGTGHTPAQAASDLLWRFLASFDNMPNPPAPDAALVEVVDVEVSISSFEPS